MTSTFYSLGNLMREGRFCKLKMRFFSGFLQGRRKVITKWANVTVSDLGGRRVGINFLFARVEGVEG